MADFKQYDPKLVIATFRGIPLGGFAGGTFIRASRKVPTFSMDIGAVGDGTRVRSRNKSGEITVTLMAASTTNDLLSTAMVQDELTGLGFGTFMIKNLLGTDTLLAATAWIVKPPDFEAAVEASNREWMFETTEFEVFLGGSLI